MRHEIEGCRGRAEEEVRNYVENAPNSSLGSEIEGSAVGDGLGPSLTCVAYSSCDGKQAGGAERIGERHRVDSAIDGQTV